MIDGSEPMPVSRRALLAVPAGLSLRAQGQERPSPSNALPEADEHIEVKIVLDVQDPKVQLKIIDPRSDRPAIVYPTQTGAEVAFAGRLRKVGCITDYDCEVTWSGNFVETIRLWVFWTRNTELNLVLRPYDAPAIRKYVDRLERLVPKDSRNDAMQCYIGGRRIFRKLSETSNRYSVLAICALRVWLSGAIAAYDFEHSFGRDEALVQTIARFRRLESNDSMFSKRWNREFESSSELVKQFELYKTLEFGMHDEIPQLIEKNDLRSAGILVEELIRRLDGTQGSTAIELRNISRDQLQLYRELIRSRAG
jgi:hypothetical protein